MALIIEDRVKETSTSTGTGAFTLAGAVTGFKAFSSVCTNADTVYYVIQGVDGGGNPTTEWEVGTGSWGTGGVLSRTTPLSSSNGGALVNFSAGLKQAWLDVPAKQVKEFTPPTIVDATTSTYKEVYTMPDATTCFIGQEIILSNDGNFDKIIKDFSGVTLGYLQQYSKTTVVCKSNATSSGVWLTDLQPTGVLAEQLYQIPFGTADTAPDSIQLDSDRTIIVLRGINGVWAIVYNSATGVFGTMTLVRSGATSSSSIFARPVETDSVLVVSCSDSTALEAVVLSVSGLVVTVNTPVSATLASVFTATQNRNALFSKLGTANTYVLAYERSSDICEVRAITVSGTTPTIGAAATLTNYTAVNGTYSQSNTVCCVIGHSASNFIAVPVSVSGTTCTLGTAASTASTLGVTRSLQISSGRVITAHRGAAAVTVTTIAGTVASNSTVFFPNTTQAVLDWVEISSDKVLVSSYGNFDYHLHHANIDGSGVLTLSSPIVAPLLVGGGIVEKSGSMVTMLTGSSGQYAGILADCSGTAPSITVTTSSLLSLVGLPSTELSTGLFSSHYLKTKTGRLLLSTQNQMSALAISNGIIYESKPCRVMATPSVIPLSSQYQNLVVKRDNQGGTVKFILLEST